MKTQLPLSKGIPTHLFMAKQITSLCQLLLANSTHCLTWVFCEPSILFALALVQRAAFRPVPRVVDSDFFQKYQNSDSKIWRMKLCTIKLIDLLIWMSTTVASSSFWAVATVTTLLKRTSFFSKNYTPKYVQDHALFPLLHYLYLFFMRLVSAVLSNTSASTFIPKE